MPAVVSRFQDGPDRKRRAHAKSRKGCGNCKLRRVKCDETRPRCRKCLAYGVSCDYDGSKPSLDLAAQGSFQVDLFQPSSTEKIIDFSTAPQKSPVSINKTMASMVNASMNPSLPDVGPSLEGSAYHSFNKLSFWTFTEEHLEILKRFQERTVMTIGNSQTAPTYRDCISHLTFYHPFLMHMVLSLTLMHDAYLATPYNEELGGKYHHASLQHWNTATKLFNNVLSKPIPPSSRDAVWATGALLGAASFAYVEASGAEAAWPLKPSEPTDLDWLKLSEGKKAIWQVANPTRPDSIFHGIARKMNRHSRSPEWLVRPDLSFLPAHLKSLFNITSQSTPQNNVYYFPIILLSRLHGVTLTHDNVVEFLMFMAFIPPEFKNALEIKDPRALLLLLWWFRKLEGGDLWWLLERAKFEGKAVEIWLERYYGGEDGLTKMFSRLRQDDEGRKEKANQTAKEAPFPSSVANWIKERTDAGCPVQ
ncbi:hypothetical protein P280DRAFT_469762 [Massarina eburnea CBS 473.64]|uniref:Zn(2)-C6 fungal-type domain-containing protein n=1 Tax=Massarina eburnea CBS 473.64 TaxID=1395130 RepID=A0A6A6RZ25_9PLEO|nr:hypothetical protein P280DRAFT_469762 [Massarina eburnea CBS 473.64]